MIAPFFDLWSVNRVHRNSDCSEATTLRFPKIKLVCRILAQR